MKEATIRIGDKHKSVRVKKYFLDFYSRMLNVGIEETKLHAYKTLCDGLKIMSSEFVTADYVVKRMLVDIELNVYGELKSNERLFPIT